MVSTPSSERVHVRFSPQVPLAANMVPTPATMASSNVNNFLFIVVRLFFPSYAFRDWLLYNSHLYTQKSVKFVYSSRSTRASQSPQKVEKQPKSTPDMQTLPPIEWARTDIYISTRTFIVAVRTLFLEFCEDSDQSQTTSINVFLCHVLLFYVSE